MIVLRTFYDNRFYKQLKIIELWGFLNNKTNKPFKLLKQQQRKKNENLLLFF